MVFLLSDTVIITTEHQLITERIIKNSDYCINRNGLSIKEVMFKSLSENFLDHETIFLRPYTALVVMVIMTVSKSEDSEDYELELCKNRGADWRHNQHNYIFSGFLKKVGCRVKTEGNLSV